MILITHLLFALSSMFTVAVLYIKPTLGKFRLSYGLITGTVATGTYLVVSTHSSILSSCVTGLVYLALVSVGVFASKHKLAMATQKVK